MAKLSILICRPEWASQNFFTLSCSVKLFLNFPFLVLEIYLFYLFILLTFFCVLEWGRFQISSEVFGFRSELWLGLSTTEMHYSGVCVVHSGSLVLLEGKPSLGPWALWVRFGSTLCSNQFQTQHRGFSQVLSHLSPTVLPPADCYFSSELENFAPSNLEPPEPVCSLRTSGQAPLVAPQSRLKTKGQRVCVVRAVLLWNILPQEVTPARSWNSSESLLQGFYFFICNRQLWTDSVVVVLRWHCFILLFTIWNLWCLILINQHFPKKSGIKRRYYHTFKIMSVSTDKKGQSLFGQTLHWLAS